jgi:hypothetical protein
MRGSARIAGAITLDVPSLGAKYYLYDSPAEHADWMGARQVCLSRGLDLATVEMAITRDALNAVVEPVITSKWCVVSHTPCPLPMTRTLASQSVHLSPS